EAEIMAIESACNTSKERGDSEGKNAAARQVDPHDLGGEIMVPDRDERTAIACAGQIGDADERDDNPEQDEVKIARIAVQLNPENAGGLRERAGRSSGEPVRAGKKVLQDILAGEGGDGE